MAGHLHFDCFSGVSGDMTLAALLDLGVPEPLVRETLDSLGLEGRLVVQRVKKNGFAACKIDVETPPQHKHRHLSHILAILEKGSMTAGARDIATRMFTKLAEAEAKSHGVAIEKVHFHEVGAVDSIFDFVGVAVAIDHLTPSRVTSRPVPTGIGTVRCEHGVLPVPAPAVANLLIDVPLAPSKIEAELTTPTGAAILKTLVHEYVESPSMTIEKVGLGAGTKEFPEQPNLLRLFWGDSSRAGDQTRDVLWELSVNLDDATGEQIGYCQERLFAAGAVEVFSSAVQMKKNRPGILLTVLCDDSIRPAVEKVLFRETGTFGVRRHQVERSKLERRAVSVETPWGALRGKLGWNHDARIFAPEYEDCARAAKEHGIALSAVYRAAMKAFEQESMTQGKEKTKR